MNNFPTRSRRFAAVTLTGAIVATAIPVQALTATAANAAIPAIAPAAAKAPAFRATHARYGIRGSRSVKNLQRMLIRKRFATTGLRRAGATGAYLGQTKASVTKLQLRLGFRGSDADGIIGRTSAGKLGLRWVGASKPAPSPSQPSAPSSPGSALSPVALKNVLYRAGFREPAIRTAWALVMRESRAYPAIVSPKNSNGTRDHGLFQINDVHRSYVDFSRIYDPLYNAQVAYSFTRGGVDFSAWGLGTNGWAGHLKKYYPQTWAKLRDLMLYWKARYPG